MCTFKTLHLQTYIPRHQSILTYQRYHTSLPPPPTPSRKPNVPITIQTPTTIRSTPPRAINLQSPNINPTHQKPLQKLLPTPCFPTPIIIPTLLFRQSTYHLSESTYRAETYTNPNHPLHNIYHPLSLIPQSKQVRYNIQPQIHIHFHINTYIDFPDRSNRYTYPSHLPSSTTKNQ